MRRRGFSIVELMLVMSILAVLASIAIPYFKEFTLRSRRAEAMPNLQGIGNAQTAYYAAYDAYVNGASNPGKPLNRSPQAFNPTATGWKDVNWSPDGLVRCTYITTVFGGTSPWVRNDAYCDVDDDNNVAIIRYYVARPSGEGGYYSDVYPTWY